MNIVCVLIMCEAWHVEVGFWWRLTGPYGFDGSRWGRERSASGGLPERGRRPSRRHSPSSDSSIAPQSCYYPLASRTRLSITGLEEHQWQRCIVKRHMHTYADLKEIQILISNIHTKCTFTYSRTKANTKHALVIPVTLAIKYACMCMHIHTNNCFCSQ